MTTPYAFDLDRCVVFDVECYPNRWMVGFYGPGRDGAPRIWPVDGDRDKLARRLRNLAGKGKTLVGYNSAHYDVPVIRAILAGRDPFEITQEIIEQERKPSGLGAWPEFPCDHVDLAFRLKREGDRLFPSLKTVATHLGLRRLRELPFPAGSTLTDEEWAEVLAYNEVDLGHTWEVLKTVAPELESLAALSQELGFDLRSTPAPKVVDRVFEAAYAREFHGTRPIRPETPREIVYRPVSGIVRPRPPEAAAWYDQIVNVPLRVQVSINPETRQESIGVLVPKLEIGIGGRAFQVGAGGLHSVDLPGWYCEDETSELWYADVASYYPSLIASKGISSAAYGACGEAIYRSLRERRLKIKEQAKRVSDPQEGKRLLVQSDALKLILNSTFGKFGDRFSTLFDPSAALAVTFSGQLFLIDLVERLQGVAVDVLSVNTDGLYLRIPRGDSRWREVLEEWQRRSEMTLEPEPIRRLAIAAGNNYAHLTHSGKVKRKGNHFKGDLSPHQSPNSLVVADAAADALLRDVPPEKTIRDCQDFVRFCRVTRRTKAVAAGVLLNEANGEEPLPKVSRWYKANGSKLRIEHRFADGRKITPNHATEIRLALDLNEDGSLPSDLDRNWYCKEARGRFLSIAGYPHLDRALLKDHPLATEVYARGLTPAPKNKKSLPPGANPKIPTYLWDSTLSIGWLIARL